MNSPNEEGLKLAVRYRPSAFKKNLLSLNAGEKVKICVATGRFTLSDDDRPLIFLIGGIGIAPCLSILAELAQRHDRRPVTLLYANPEPRAIAYRQFLVDLFQNHSNWQIHLIVEQAPTTWRGEVGLIDRNLLEKYQITNSKSYFYVSGPPAMVSRTVNHLTNLGVPDELIKTEDMTGY